MYRVFIVDDEPSVTEGLKIMIPWSELGFELCGTASSGQEALDRIEKQHPHLIITDIRIPGINGLELIQEAQKLDFDTEFVILSGYADFSYAQEAMRRKVLNYMLKPLDQDEIISVLRDIKNKLDAKFLTIYGFSQADIETFKNSRNLTVSAACYENFGPQDEAVKSVWDNFDEKLTTSITLMNYDEAMKLIDDMFVFFKEKDVNITNTAIMVNSCVYRILQIAYNKNIKLNTILPAITGETNFNSLKNYISNIVSQIINLMLEERKKNSKGYLYDVKKYIDENYQNEISVAFLADMVFLEAGYLGDAFNKQFGLSISEYQHRLRIEKAIELIKTTDLKLSEVSSAAGYNNYNNFFSHFVRITNKKPTQYQRKR